MRWTALLLAVALLCACSSSSDDAHELETRLYAPCCWRQTLADHHSPLATELRAEIATRVTAGERTEVIERSLVDRYGERILAVGHHDRRPYIGGIAGVLIALGLVGIVVIGRRRRSAPVAPRRESDEDADRLDDELAAMTD